MDRVRKFILRLEAQVVLALLLAIMVGLFSEQFSLFINAAVYLISLGFVSLDINIVHLTSWMGDLFMKCLKLFLAPLLFFSIFLSVIGLGDFNKLGKIGGRTMGYYVITTSSAIIISLVLMNIFKPGVGSSLGTAFSSYNADKIEALTFSSFLDSLLPSNFIVPFVEMNAMQIVSVGIILAIAVLASAKKDELEITKRVFETINNGILAFISFIIKLTPFGVFGIVVKVVYENGADSMISLLPFVYIILGALAIHAFLVLPILGYSIGKFNPYNYIRDVKEPILVGFSTSSSSATMGLTMKTAEEKGKVSKEIVNFSVPIGTTINMDGTALYQAGVAIFVAQVLGIDLSISQQFTVVFIVILASIGAAGIPGAGILILATVFLSIGLPIEAIGIILAVDRILDMFRTGVNVWGDLLTAKVVDSFYLKDIEAQKRFQEKKSDKEQK